MRRTLVQKAEGTLLPKVLHKYIHKVVHNYPMVIASIKVAGWRFHCAVVVVPCLDCLVLLGWDFPVLAQLMSEHTTRAMEGELPGGILATELIQWQEVDPTLR